MMDHLGVKGMANSAKHHIPLFMEKLPEMPGLAYEVLRKAARDELRIQYDSKQLDKLRQELRAANQRTVTAIAGGSALLGAIGLVTVPETEMTLGMPTGALVMGVIGIGLLFWAWVKSTD
jgi:ubiquinone biosynthesis protein